MKPIPSPLPLSISVSKIDISIQENRIDVEAYKSNVVVILTCIAVPSIPTNFATSDVTSDTATFTWTPGHDGNLAQIFQLYYRPNTANEFQLGANTSFGQASITIVGLSPSTNYTAYVVGRNSLGLGTPSSFIEFTTLAGMWVNEFILTSVLD